WRAGAPQPPLSQSVRHAIRAARPSGRGRVVRLRVRLALADQPGHRARACPRGSRRRAGPTVGGGIVTGLVLLTAVGTGIGLWLIVVGLWPRPPRLDKALAAMDPSPEPVAPVPDELARW